MKKLNTIIILYKDSNGEIIEISDAEDYHINEDRLVITDSILSPTMRIEVPSDKYIVVHDNSGADRETWEEELSDIVSFAQNDSFTNAKTKLKPIVKSLFQDWLGGYSSLQSFKNHFQNNSATI